VGWGGGLNPPPPGMPLHVGGEPHTPTTLPLEHSVPALIEQDVWVAPTVSSEKKNLLPPNGNHTPDRPTHTSVTLHRQPAKYS
jgi:hypothetical protein